MLSYKIKNDNYELQLPSLILGTANIELNDNDDLYFPMLDRYVEKGGNCIDTARIYCSWIEDGKDASESTIGRWLKARNNRDKIILMTKGGHHAHNEEGEIVSRLNQKALWHDLNKSLECLQTDYIDIFFLHRDDPEVPVSEIMPILNDMVTSGKVHFLGASNWSTSRIEQANKFAEENGLEPFRVSQINYSLAHMSSDVVGDPTQVCMNMESYAWYTKNNFPVMAFSPQAKGFFMKLEKGENISNQMESAFVSTANLGRLSRLKDVCKATEYSTAQICLAYLNSQKFPVSSVFAVSKLWQLDENMEAQDIKLTKSAVAYLEMQSIPLPEKLLIIEGK